MLREKAETEITVQGELVSATAREYFIEAVYRLPGDVYRVVEERKNKGTDARETETVIPKIREFKVKKQALA